MIGTLRCVRTTVSIDDDVLRDAKRRAADQGQTLGELIGLIEQPTCLPVSAGARHWTILRGLLRDADARANLVPDAHLAAIAIANGATVATRDRGFARFPGLRWMDPLRG